MTGGEPVDKERRDAELARLSAETAKLTADKTKLDSEVATERAKLEAAKLRAENAKLAAEKAKLETDKKLEWFKTAGAVLIGLGALLTFGLGFWTRLDEKDARFRAEAARLVESLGAKKAQSRAAAAIGLRSFLDDKETRGLVIDSLAFGLGLELNPDVQQAMADSLASSGSYALPSLRRMLPRVNGEVQVAFNKIGDMKSCHDSKQELEPVRARQKGMVAAVLALAEIESVSPKRSGSVPPPRMPARRDFSGLNFKCFEFYGLGPVLRGGLFKNATIWDADFFGVDLSNVDFSGAKAFGAKFQQADMTGAVFTDAVLDAANFTGAKGLQTPQLKVAKSLTCAKFSPPLVDDLKAETKPPEGNVCP
jgi:Pentapeptide repeats (8 copies)